MEINLSSNFVGIFNTKSELIRTKAQIGDFAFVKDTKYTLIKYPYYKSKNWYKIKEFGGVKMELFASEKENECLKLNKKCEISIIDYKPAIVITDEELNKPIKTYNLNVKSLGQHDSELKTKWCDELLEWLNETDGKWSYYTENDDEFEAIDVWRIENKLIEIKEIT